MTAFQAKTDGRLGLGKNHDMLGVYGNGQITAGKIGANAKGTLALRNSKGEVSPTANAEFEVEAIAAEAKGSAGVSVLGVDAGVTGSVNVGIGAHAKFAMEDYKIKIDAFEGPMDLLMHLIEKNKIDIYDIPIAELTRQYLDYLDKFREFNIEIASSFLVMAATLLQIKSRMMLPKAPKEEGAPEEDPRLELVQRILEYRKFKQVSQVLGDMAGVQERFVAREPMELPVHHLPPGNLSLRQLVEAFHTVLTVKEELSIPKALVEPEEYSIKDKMENIILLLGRSRGKLLFSEAFRSGTRSELIVTFLALLELMKLRTVTVKQQRSFAEIYICVREEEVHA